MIASMRSANIAFFLLLLFAFLGCREEVPQADKYIVFDGVLRGDSTASISLANTGPESVDISGWYVKSSLEPQYKPFLEGTVINTKSSYTWSASFFPFDLNAPGISLLLFNDADEEQDVWIP